MRKSIWLILFVCILMSSCEHRSRQTTDRHQTASHNQQIHRSINGNASNGHYRNKVTTTDGGNIVRMEKRGGVFYVPIKIDGVDMDVIFDTGASDVVISSVEAAFLYRQHKLTEEDFLGESSYQVANGEISVGVVVNLKTVQIANKVVHNVQATVVDNIEAPLLLGQTALSEFGKISIDYNKGIIEFLE